MAKREKLRYNTKKLFSKCFRKIIDIFEGKTKTFRQSKTIWCEGPKQKKYAKRQNWFPEVISKP